MKLHIRKDIMSGSITINGNDQFDKSEILFSEFLNSEGLSFTINPGHKDEQRFELHSSHLEAIIAIALSTEFVNLDYIESLKEKFKYQENLYDNFIKE